MTLATLLENLEQEFSKLKLGRKKWGIAEVVHDLQITECYRKALYQS